MRILITGATGFVGTHVVRVMADGVEPFAPGHDPPDIRVLVRPTSNLAGLKHLNPEIAEGHLGHQESLREALADVDIVLHLAALTRARSEKEFRAVNATGTRLLLQAAGESGTCRRFVYVSSLAAAGPARLGRPVSPGDEPHPISAYGRSKLAGETACQTVTGEPATVILRPPAVYGPGDRDLLTFFRLAHWGVLPLPTGPRRIVQMIHVSDLVRAVLAGAFAEKASGVYHVAESRAYPWEEILSLLAQAVERKGRFVPIPGAVLKLAGRCNEAVGRVLGKPQIFDRDKVKELLATGWLCETERAERDLGFSTEIPLAKGFRQTAAWYKRNGWLKGRVPSERIP